jgi:nucleoside-diphosphate-sugar epimerase
MKLTVVGARSFIGSAVAELARARGVEVLVVPHDAVPPQALGVVVYCSGLAWGADQQPEAAYRLHVSEPLALLATRRFDRFLYLSSTRVYDRSASTDETAALFVDPLDPHGVYPASKIAGEAALLSASDKTVALRLSNVFGPNLTAKVFLSDIIRQAVETGRIQIRTALGSSKDYVSVDDVADLVLRIAGGSRQRVYNVAAGHNTTHQQIIDAIAAVLPVEVSVTQDAPLAVAQTIDIRRVRDEFGFAPRELLGAIPVIVGAFRRSA